MIWWYSGIFYAFLESGFRGDILQYGVIIANIGGTHCML